MSKTSFFVGVALVGALVLPFGCDDDATNCHEDPCEPGHEEGGAGAGGEGASDAARAYCDCMLVSCHDTYHLHFGPESDEMGARESCLAEAAALPEAGMDVDMGNSIECRQHYCELGKTDDSVCPNTIGGVCE